MDSSAGLGQVIPVDGIEARRSFASSTTAQGRLQTLAPASAAENGQVIDVGMTDDLVQGPAVAPALLQRRTNPGDFHRQCRMTSDRNVAWLRQGHPESGLPLSSLGHPLKLSDDFRRNVPRQHDDLTWLSGDQVLDRPDGDMGAGYSAAMLCWRQVDRVWEQRPIDIRKGHQNCSLRRCSIPGNGNATNSGRRKLIVESSGSNTTSLSKRGHGRPAVKASTSLGFEKLSDAGIGLGAILRSPNDDAQASSECRYPLRLAGD